MLTIYRNWCSSFLKYGYRSVALFLSSLQFSHWEPVWGVRLSVWTGYAVRVFCKRFLCSEVPSKRSLQGTRWWSPTVFPICLAVAAPCGTSVSLRWGPNAPRGFLLNVTSGCARRQQRCPVLFRMSHRHKQAVRSTEGTRIVPQRLKAPFVLKEKGKKHQVLSHAGEMC